MKIGFDFRCASTSYSGVGVYVKNLLLNLLRLDSTHTYYLFVDHPIDMFLPKTDRVYLYPLHNKNRFYWEQVSLPLAANYLKLDILHRPNDIGGVMIPLQMKYVVTVHDLIPVVFKHIYLRRPHHRAYYYFKLLQTRYLADHILTVSNYSKQEIVKYIGLDATKITVTYHGLETNDKCTTPINFDNHQFSSIESLLQSRKIILGIGGSEYRKNNISLIRAFEKIAFEQEFSIYDLVIVGRKWRNNEELHDFVKANRLKYRIHLLEDVSDDLLSKLYCKSAVFVFTSLYEGFGIPLLEAMKNETPIITSTVTALPEIAGDAAILVDPLDIDSIADSLRLVLTNEAVRLALIKQGKRRLKEFDYTQMAQETLRVYQSL